MFYKDVVWKNTFYNFQSTTCCGSVIHPVQGVDIKPVFGRIAVDSSLDHEHIINATKL